MTTYYASQSGAGAKDGTTVATAWDLAGINWATVGGGGNTLYIMGAITERVVVGVGADGLSGNPTVLRGDLAGQECTITPILEQPCIACTSHDYVDFTGFILKGVITTKAGLLIVTSTGNKAYGNTFQENSRNIQISDSDYVDVYENTIITDGTTYDGSGIYLKTNANNCLIHDNTVTGNGDATKFQTGIFMELGATANTIYKNKVSGISGDAIIFKGCDSNTIHSNTVGPIFKDGIALEDSDSNLVYNNTVIQDDFYGTTFPPIKLGDNFGAGLPADSNIIKNNIFYKAGASFAGVYGQAGFPIGVNNTIDNNIYWNGTTGSEIISYFDGGAGSTIYTFTEFQALGYEANGFDADPLLTNNYPASTSPAVGAGTKWWTGPNPESFTGEAFSDFDTDIGAVMTTYSPRHPKNL